MSSSAWWVIIPAAVSAAAGVLAAVYPLPAAIMLVLVVAGSLMFMARARVRGRVVEELAEPKLNLAIALFPLFVSVRQSAEVTGGLLALIIVMMVFQKKPESNVRAYLLPLLLLAASAAIVFRSQLGAPLAVTGLALIFLFIAATKVERQVALKSLGVGIGVYLIANVIGHYANIPSPLDNSRIGGYQTSTALFAERIAFPFARSINEPGAVAAAYIGLIAATWVVGRRVSKFHYIGLAAASFVMVGSNSRLPLVIAVILTLGALISPMLTKRISLPAVLLAGALPFYLQLAQPLIRFVAETAASVNYLSRGQSVEEIVGLGTRGTIWTGSVDYWNRYLNQEQQLFGFGPNGHATSGANGSYLNGLGGFLADKTNLTTHNTFLQQLYDGGLVGLFLFSLALIITMRRLASDLALLPHLVALTVIGVGAASEVAVAPGSTNTPFFLLLAFAAFSPARRLNEATEEAPHRTEQSSHLQPSLR